MKNKKISLVFLFSLFAVGCNYNHIKNSEPDDKVNDQLKQSSQMTLDYVAIQQKIIGPDCLRCHSASGGMQGGLSLENYESIRLNLNKIYYRAIQKKDMPAEGLKASSFQILKNWLESGAPENSIAVFGDINGPINWDVIKNRVFASSCLDCHSGSKPDANLDLTNLELTRTNFQKIFETVLIKQSMPVQPYPAMPENAKIILMRWISQGMPN